MKLSALAMIMFAACAASQSGPARPWRIEVTTSGGIAGRGVGTYAISSGGEVTIVTMNGRTCTFQASTEDVARFERLLTDAKRESWNASYAPADRCCDRIEYTLTIDEAGSKRSVEWIDDPLPMPAGLVALSGALIGGEGSLRTRYTGLCR